MIDDPIVAEIRKYREDFAKRFNYDIAAMVEYLRGQEQRHPERLTSLSPKPPRARATLKE